jgi:hypothetical protein
VPLGGHFTQNEPLSLFDGEPINGRYSQTISDASAGFTGSVHDLCVNLLADGIFSDRFEQ